MKFRITSADGNTRQEMVILTQEWKVLRF